MILWRWRVINTVAVCLLIGAELIDCDEQELRLHKYLMSNYDPAVRPAIHFVKPLSVNFSLSLHKIIDVDEKNQILTTNCWLTQIWLDNHLTWNESEFGGIRVIRLPYHRVWRPDIILYNNADPQYTSSVINTNVIVTHTGEVTWLSHGIYKSSCDINVEYFPFDIQNCSLKWASWTYDGYQLDLQTDTQDGDMSNYQTNGEFELLGFRAVRNVHTYSCCPEPYPDVTYTIALKRRPMFYVFNLIIPCFLINGIALLVFFVPSDSGEKVTLGISALLSMTVFLMTIRESLPPTEKTPLIGVYYGVSICIVTFASAMAVVTLNIHHRGFRGVQVPRVLRFLILRCCARLLLVQNSTEPPDDPKDPVEAFKEIRLQLNGLHPTLGHRLDPRSASRKYDYADVIQRSPRYDPKADELEMKIIRIASRICETIEKCELRTANQLRLDANQLEWKKLSLVLDRFLFWAFLICTCISSTVILFSSPYGPSLGIA
ncbi:unnamed protein product [Allacma fusca]|uniref:Uncharacterized protein n=1 Tax=Allacma fusca TaxID=39272 RepID=A0A8J2LDV5_9HEXA|nr:unnamed protein product [Allacma fusca]